MPAAPLEGVGYSSLVSDNAKAKSRINNKSSMLLKALNSTTGSSPTTPSVVTSAPIKPAKVPATSGQLVDYLKQAGFKGEALRKAWAVAMRESGGRPGAYNGNAATGDKSYGLFQINMIGSLGANRLKQFGLSSYDQLLDPNTNAQAAFRMSKGGTSWGAWDIDSSGYNYSRNRASWQKHYNAYLKYYNAFPAATKQLGLQSAAAARLK